MNHSEDILSISVAQQYVNRVCHNELTTELLLALKDFTDDDLSNYSDFIDSSFSYTEPVFYRPRYAEFIWHCATTVRSWLDQVVLEGIIGEYSGSIKLLALWKEVIFNKEIEDHILAHAKDECRHSRIYFDLTQQAFPYTFPPSIFNELKESYPDIRKQDHKKADKSIPEDLLMDYIVRENIGEIRTHHHLHLLAPLIYAHTPKENKNSVRKILEGLVRDEVRHIGDAARLIEEWARNGDRDYLLSLYMTRTQDFNSVVIEEIEPIVHNLGQGRFPDLLEL